MKNTIFDLGEVFNYISKYLKSISTKGVYIVLLLIYAYKDVDTPAWAKRIIIGALAYFVSPIDSIPDLTPFIGMTDDMGVLSFGLVTIACYIDNDVKLKAKEKLIKLMGTKVDDSNLVEVDNWL
jgi:uncharacterized membrane protein YkvA (DUF1232 family)